MLNFNAIEKAQLQHEPYSFALVDNLLDKKNADFLITNAPSNNNYLSLRESGSDKTYQVINNIIVPLGTNIIKLEEKNTYWMTLIRNLMSDEYKNRLSKLLQIELADSYQEITFKHYREGDYISPHTDRDMVLATHMIFLNSTWQPTWGGMFCIMHNENDSYLELPPLWNQSIAFLQSKNSWHAVTKCMSKTEKRYSIQVAFKDTLDVDSPIGRYEQLI